MSASQFTAQVLTKRRSVWQRAPHPSQSRANSNTAVLAFANNNYREVWSSSTSFIHSPLHCTLFSQFTRHFVISCTPLIDFSSGILMMRVVIVLAVVVGLCHGLISSKLRTSGSTALRAFIPFQSNIEWRPDSWKRFPIKQPPSYPDQVLHCPSSYVNEFHHNLGCLVIRKLQTMLLGGLRSVLLWSSQARCAR